jgi:hypothetical protein
MMCGSPGMLEELKVMFESGGFIEGSGNNARPFRDREGVRRALGRLVARMERSEIRGRSLGR